MQKQENDFINSISNSPAQLWVGDNQNLVLQVQKYLQKVYCKNSGCGVCYICKQIINKQYYLTTWIDPDGQYKIDDIEIIFEKISFSLDPGQHYYFILNHADTLTQATAASLLKSIEEPPAGYNFILLAQRPDFIPKTIASRCVVKNFDGQIDFAKHPILDFFMSDKICNILQINKALELKPSERESRDMVDFLLKYWGNKQKQAILSSDQNILTKSTRIIEFLELSLSQFQMPGSAKIFWRNLYLQYLSCL